MSSSGAARSRSRAARPNCSTATGRCRLAGSALILLAACAGPEVAGPAPGGEPAPALRLDADSVTVLVGEPAGLHASLVTADGAILEPGPLTWTSRDPTIVRSLGGGVVAAAGLGATWIVAGDGTRRDSARVGVQVRFTDVQAGTDASCGTTAQGLVLCWGWNDYGALGTGSFANARRPVIAAGGRAFGGIVVGGGTVCGYAGSGLWCWGYNGAGQLADGSITSRAVPVDVAKDLVVASADLGAGTTPCARTDAGTLHCWGWNRYGQLLNGSRYSSRAVLALAAPVPLASVTGGGGHMCGLDGAGAAWCWGRGEAGQLGRGTLEESDQPAPVVGGLRFVQVAAGMEHTCGRTATGAVWCWGGNALGQLGVGLGPASPVPVRVATLPPVDTIVTTRDHTCALAAHAAWCWGADTWGQVGSGDAHGSATVPLPVAGGIAFASISAGTSHTCGLDVAGVAWCWGRNRQGGIGNGGVADVPAPVRVAGQP